MKRLAFPLLLSILAPLGFSPTVFAERPVDSRIDGYLVRARADRLEAAPSVSSTSATVEVEDVVDASEPIVEVTFESIARVVSEANPNIPLPVIEVSSPVDVYSTVFGDSRSEAFSSSASSALPSGKYQALVIDEGQLVAFSSSEGTSVEDPQRIASVSKVVTSSAIFRLIEAGQLSLDTKVAPLLGIEYRDSWNNLTVEELLSQKSGIEKNTSLWFSGRWNTCAEAAAYSLNRNPQYRGSFVYSNTNSCILSLLIEAVTGKSYTEAVNDLVFAPLNMNSPEVDNDYLNLMGAGFWRISALDLGRLLCSLAPDATGTELCVADFLSDESKQLMQTRTSWSYGLGSWIFNDQSWGHSGTLSMGRNIAVDLADGPVVVIQHQANHFKSGLDLLPVAARLVEEIGL